MTTLTKLTKAELVALVQARDAEIAQLRVAASQAQAPRAQSAATEAFKRPVVYVALDREHAFKARAALARKRGSAAAFAPISTPRGTAYAVY